MGAREVAKRFRRSGGWFMAVVSLPSWSYGLSPTERGYRRLFEMVEEEAKLLNDHGINTIRIIGVHPAEVHKMVRGLGADEALNRVLRIYSIAESFIREDRADGLGEVGRPHYETGDIVIKICNKILDHVLRMASDLKCAVHIHSEQRGESTIVDLSERVRRSGAKTIIFHHASPKIAKMAMRHGLIPSIPAKKDDLIEAIKWDPFYVVESDFLDDPSRPGAVVAPWSIFKTVKRLIDSGLIDQSYALKILEENLTKIYNLGGP